MGMLGAERFLGVLPQAGTVGVYVCLQTCQKRPAYFRITSIISLNTPPQQHCEVNRAGFLVPSLQTNKLSHTKSK